MNNTRWKPSVTVAAVMAHEGRYLLVEEHTAQGLRWNTPAGHLEPGETPLQGAMREALEETGHPFEPSALLGIYMAAGPDAQGHDTTWLRFAYCGLAGPRDAQRRLDKGIVRAVWLTPAEIHACRHLHRSPLVWRCVQDHMAGQRHSLDTVLADPSALRGNFA